MISIPDHYSPERALITALLESAIRDYFYPGKICSAGGNKNTLERNKLRYQELARRFLFDDDYLMDFGDITLSPYSLLEQIDLNLKELRVMILNKMDSGINTNSRAPLLGQDR